MLSRCPVIRSHPRVHYLLGRAKSPLIGNNWKALCIGARMEQEMGALKRVVVLDSVGIDLVPSPPLVVKGEFHRRICKAFLGSALQLLNPIELEGDDGYGIYEYDE
uniref:Uncharacterized protein n=1 Tax=Nelumbo nucifera TaxID=4432 RepID=A0A822XD75_NELNU|nr:TPA_asm: hypothetical protein HUJ06_019600 [Nelumbo nucifera]